MDYRNLFKTNAKDIGGLLCVILDDIQTSLDSLYYYYLDHSYTPLPSPLLPTVYANSCVGREEAHTLDRNTSLIKVLNSCKLGHLDGVVLSTELNELDDGVYISVYIVLRGDMENAGYSEAIRSINLSMDDVSKCVKGVALRSLDVMLLNTLIDYYTCVSEFIDTQFIDDTDEAYYY